ncbi:hypothetical protein DSL72_006680 [Monilinia vaccinii-corymbosi]|uniref:C2H2-type domain-containing protein n=1 Tax=Monilinia vaccinii-corymbosi TaxID=61207 RepID=A0A8A3PMU8_9HELO|nr:hypothetical protein DSL72_006680 [Monilinia vaccinii-corymbosi]
MDPVYFLPVSPRVPSDKFPSRREYLCPTINTDVHQFKDQYDYFQQQEVLMEKPWQPSSPNTATTTTSNDSHAADSGYGSLATESYSSSIASPGSLYSGYEQSGDDILCLYKDVQLSGFSYGNYLSQNIHSQSQQIETNDFVEELLELSAARCFLGPQTNEFGSDDAGDAHTCFDAYTAQVIADMGSGSPSDNLYAGEEPQSRGSTFQSKAVRFFNPLMPISDQLLSDGAFVSAQAQNNQDQLGSNLLLCHKAKNAYAPPWSAESLRELATTPTQGTSFLKTAGKTSKCHYPGCNLEQRGQAQRKPANLRRHIKEKHEMKTEDRPVCTKDDCKITFTRLGNLNTHLGKKHDVSIFKKAWNKRSTGGVEQIKRPRAKGRIIKATKVGPRQSQSQSAPGTLENAES